MYTHVYIILPYRGKVCGFVGFKAEVEHRMMALGPILLLLLLVVVVVVGLLLLVVVLCYC